MKRRYLYWAWPVAVLLVMTLAIFWRVLFSHFTFYPLDELNGIFLPFAADRSGLAVKTTIHVDYIDCFYPIRYFIRESLLNGELPLWCPYIRGGYPQYASSGSVNTLDPFNILWLVIGLLRGLAWRSALQVFFCGVFMFWYLRVLKVGRFGAWVGAAALAFNSMFWANLYDYSLSALVWWPLSLGFLHKARTDSSVSTALVSGLFLGVGLLASPIQFGVYLLFTYIGVAFASWWALGDRAERRARFPRLFRNLSLALLVGLGLAAVQLIPTLELISLNQAEIGKITKLRSPIEALMAVGGFSSFIFPNLAGRIPEAMRIAELWGGSQHFQGFIGAIPFVFGLMTIVSVRRRIKYPFLILAAFSLIAVLTPLRMFLYDRFLIVYIFGMAVMAALGADAFLNRTTDDSRAALVIRCSLILTGVLIGLVTLFSIVYTANRDYFDPKLDAYLLHTLKGRYLEYAVELHRRKLEALISDYMIWNPAMFAPLGLAVLGLITMILYRKGRIGPVSCRVILVTVIASDLIAASLFQNAEVDMKRNPAFESTAVIRRIASDKDGPFRVASLRRSTAEQPIMTDNMWTPYGIQGWTGGDNFSLPDVCRFSVSLLKKEGSLARLLDLADVRYVLANEADNLKDPSLRRLMTADKLTLYENTDHLPRAYFVDEFVVEPDSARAYALLLQPDFNPRKTVILPSSASVTPGVREGDSDAAVTEYAPRAVEIRVSTPLRRILVLDDSYYPGWKATIDGQPAEVLRANAVMRAVIVPAGARRVRFVYDPPSVMMGMIISLATCIFSLSAIVAVRRRARSRR
jgi:hypothetical protein